MTPEVAAYLEKARQCLSNARTLSAIGLSNDAGRNTQGEALRQMHAAAAQVDTGAIARDAQARDRIPALIRRAGLCAIRAARAH